MLEAPAPLIAVARATGDKDHVAFADSWERLGGLAFGSRYLPGVVEKWRMNRRTSIAGLDRALVRVLVFDAFIEHMDRSAAHNPNLLVANGVLYAIDHGQGFPSVHGSRSGFAYNYNSHIAWPVLVERRDLLEEALAPLMALRTDAIDAAIAAVPPLWWPTPTAAQATRAALVARLDVVPRELRDRMELS